MQLTTLFFGSFQKFSVQVLEKLHHHFRVAGVITTPPAPKGRHLALQPTEVQSYSENNNIPCFPIETLTDKSLADLLQKLELAPDFLVVAGYGKLIPQDWLDLPKIMSVNLHPSLLPAYPGRCPAEWAILNGETQTGVTLIKMTTKFDSGPILAQASLPISPDDTRLTLYHKLYDLGADLLLKTLPLIASGRITPRPQTHNSQPTTHNSQYARQITRQDGFIPWDNFHRDLQLLQSKRAQPDAGKRQAASTRDCKCEDLKKKIRAFAGWPGVWTTNPDGKRIKLIALLPQILVLEEGKSPTPWPA